MPKEIKVKSILNKTKKRDSWFLDDYTVNLYSSCAFNCLYCYIRGSKYGANLESSLSVRVNAIELLEKQLILRAKKKQYGIIVLSSATDPYLSLEKEYQLTRQALELIAKYRFPVHIITKSALVERDFDLLQEIDKTAILPLDLETTLKRGTIITFSFSTVDDRVGKIFESGAPSPTIRLNTLRKSVEAGFLSGVSMMPMIPYISDRTAHIDEMFTAFQQCTAKCVLPATITLFGNGKADSKTLMLNAVLKHFPELEERYLWLFSNSHQLLTYYREAFYKKMKSCHDLYGLPDGILKGAIE